MDVPLQLDGSNLPTGQPLGFNPCFNGCTSATNIDKVLWKSFKDVSILVLMDVPLQQLTISLLSDIIL